jgi:DNA-binding NarL/FixJ family response regulator
VSPSIVIVDDHRAFRAAARALLEADGFDVVGDAADAASGLQAARSLRPDVVLLDVRLPDGDGFTVARELLGDAGAPTVVLTSSSDDPGYPALALDTGAAGFLAKHDVCGACLRDLLDA